MLSEKIRGILQEKYNINEFTINCRWKSECWQITKITLIHEADEFAQRYDQMITEVKIKSNGKEDRYIYDIKTDQLIFIENMVSKNKDGGQEYTVEKLNKEKKYGYRVYFDGEKFVRDTEMTEDKRLSEEGPDSFTQWIPEEHFADCEVEYQNSRLIKSHAHIRKCQKCGKFFSPQWGYNTYNECFVCRHANW